jgi:hypothetical protein
MLPTRPHDWGLLIQRTIENYASMVVKKADDTVLNVGMDISGASGKGARYAAYGVVAALNDEVAIFHREWGHFLERHDIEYLRVADAMLWYGPFASKKMEWGKKYESTRDELLSEAATLTSKWLKAGGSSIDFGQLGKPKSGDAVKRKKTILFGHVIGTLLQDPQFASYALALVCDDEQDVAISFYQGLDAFKRQRPAVVSRIAMLCFGNDTRMPLLQAADLVAHVLRLHRAGTDSPLGAILFKGNWEEEKRDVDVTW